MDAIFIKKEYEQAEQQLQELGKKVEDAKRISEEAAKSLKTIEKAYKLKEFQRDHIKHVYESLKVGQDTSVATTSANNTSATLNNTSTTSSDVGLSSVLDTDTTHTRQIDTLPLNNIQTNQSNQTQPSLQPIPTSNQSDPRENTAYTTEENNILEQALHRANGFVKRVDLKELKGKIPERSIDALRIKLHRMKKESDSGLYKQSGGVQKKKRNRQPFKPNEYQILKEILKEDLGREALKAKIRKSFPDRTFAGVKRKLERLKAKIIQEHLKAFPQQTTSNNVSNTTQKENTTDNNNELQENKSTSPTSTATPTNSSTLPLNSNEESEIEFSDDSDDSDAEGMWNKLSNKI